MKFKNIVILSSIVLGLVFFLASSTPNLFSLNAKTALADMPVDCTGTNEPFKKPITGSVCTCDGQVVIPQVCSGSGNGCTPINCG